MTPIVWGVRRLLIALCSLMACCGAYFVNAQTKLWDEGPSRIEDIRVGMPRDKVLAALAGKYDLNQEDFGDSRLEAWAVLDKKGNSESYEIVFDDKKVRAISFHSLPT
jgi:hypothetical protein